MCNHAAAALALPSRRVLELGLRCATKLWDQTACKGKRVGAAVSYLFLGTGVCAASPVYFACANCKHKCIKAAKRKEGGGVSGRESKGG